MADLELEGQGAEKFAAVARQLREEADKNLTREFYAALTKGAQPMVESIREQFRSKLPHSGGGKRQYRKKRTGATITNAVSGKEHAVKIRVAKGLKQSESLATRAAQANITIRGKGGTDPQVNITARAKGRKRIDLRNLNAGSVRHPVFGHRDRWQPQNVPADTFTDGVEGKMDGVTEAVLQVLDDMTRRLSAGGD